MTCVIGLNEWERLVEQDVVIDLALIADLRGAAEGDDIKQTVNYRTVTKNVVAHVRGSRFRLIEALAESVAGICLAEPRVTRVDVSIRKPGALRDAQNVGVEITRGR